jgi:molybdopterin converting factor small subunit
MSVNVSVLLFAAAKDRIGGQNEIQIRIDRVWDNLEVLKKHICSNVLEQLSDLEPVLAFAINEEYVTDSHKQILLNDNDILALIPPITGG